MAKTDWDMDETVMPADMNQIGQEVNDALAQSLKPLEVNAFDFITAGTSYPTGATLMETTGSAGGWPFTYGNGQVLTFRAGNNSIAQLLFEVAAAANPQAVGFRVYREDYAAWSPVLSVPSSMDAEAIAFDPTDTGMTATDVQAAIDEIFTTSSTAQQDINALFQDISQLSSSFVTLEGNVGFTWDLETDDKSSLVAAINEVFTRVSSKLSKIAAAVTDKGVPTSEDDDGDTMAANIRAIQTGSGNAQPNDVVAPKTFTNDDGEQVGTLQDYRDSDITSDDYYSSPTALKVYINKNAAVSENSGVIVYDTKFIPMNIRKGVKVLDMEGTYEGVNTSDATASAADIRTGKTAYGAAGVKIIGTGSFLGISEFPLTLEDFTLDSGATPQLRRYTSSIIPYTGDEYALSAFIGRPNYQKPMNPITLTVTFSDGVILQYNSSVFNQHFTREFQGYYDRFLINFQTEAVSGGYRLYIECKMNGSPSVTVTNTTITTVNAFSRVYFTAQLT